MFPQPPGSRGSLSLSPSIQVCPSWGSGRSGSSYLALLGEALMWPGGPGASVGGVQGTLGCQRPLSTSPREPGSADRRASATWGRKRRGAEPEDAEPGWAGAAGHPGGRPSARGAGAPAEEEEPPPPPRAARLPLARRLRVAASPSRFL